MNYDMLRRFAFIEARLLWAGGLTANELARAFGIARQNAQQTIKTYSQQHPGQLRYDARERRQVPNEGFEVHYIRDNVGRFLDYQRAANYTAHFYDEPDWADLPFTDIDALVRPLYDKNSVRTAVEALRRKSVVIIGYWSMSGARTRRLSPHHLLYADGRYHIRAYCHETEQFRDFTLARIVTAEFSNERWVSDALDREWQQRINLEFEINPELPEQAKAALRQDHLKVGDVTLLIPGIRKALAFYVERRLGRIDNRYRAPLWRPIERQQPSYLRDPRVPW